jgi:hypothetical protein
MIATLACPKCKSPLPPSFANRGGLAPCPACGSEMEIEIFPAYFRAMERGKSGEALVLETEASCFYHPAKRATVVCASCGRYLCSLCDVEFEESHLCPPCLEIAQKKGKIKNLENRRTLRDSIALGLCLLSFLLFYFSFITAPVALYLAIKHWNTPSSILHRTKIRNVLAIIISSLQIMAWIGLIGYFLLR